MATTTVDLGNVRGPQGPAGTPGAQGPAGPNQVTAATATDITGLLKGAGGAVAAAVAGTDYAAPADIKAKTVSGGDLNSLTEPGLYILNEGSYTNIPAGLSSNAVRYLYVVKTQTIVDQIEQILYCSSDAVFTRTATFGSFGEWYQLNKAPDAMLSDVDLDTILETGVYSFDKSTAVNHLPTDLPLGDVTYLVVSKRAGSPTYEYVHQELHGRNGSYYRWKYGTGNTHQDWGSWNTLDGLSESTNVTKDMFSNPPKLNTQYIHGTRYLVFNGLSGTTLKAITPNGVWLNYQMTSNFNGLSAQVLGYYTTGSNVTMNPIQLSVTGQSSSVVFTQINGPTMAQGQTITIPGFMIKA